MPDLQALPRGGLLAHQFAVVGLLNDSPLDAKHVLVVDDDPKVLLIIERWLTQAGYRVMACSEYQAAKDHLASATPDVVLTDVRLGAFNGLQLAILAKAHEPGTQTMVMSAYDDSVLQQEAKRCGAGFLAKPFSRDDMLIALGSALKQNTILN
jgi:DNA-binding NtrC family response regulator